MKISVRNVHVSSVCGIRPGGEGLVSAEQLETYPWALKVRASKAAPVSAPEPSDIEFIGPTAKLAAEEPDRHAWKRKGKR